MISCRFENDDAGITKSGTAVRRSHNRINKILREFKTGTSP